MTINVVVATYHAVVLGCDSLSSVVERAYFPFRQRSVPARDHAGNVMRDSEGNLVVPLRSDQLVSAATNIMGGVQKMFLLHESRDPDNVECSVAAVTSGLATLNGVVIAELGQRFRRRCGSGQKVFLTAEAVAREFLAFLRPQWETEVGLTEANLEPQACSEDLEFLVAGYGADDSYIKVFRLSVAHASVVEAFPNSSHCSAAWAGQSETVASLINGQSSTTIRQISEWVDDAVTSDRSSFAQSILERLQELGIALPDPFEVQARERLSPAPPWNEGGPAIDWANLPVQSAVDLVSTLVNVESGMQRFSMGIPGVGGRTRIGILRRGEPFRALNEPEILHNHIGYAHD